MSFTITANGDVANVAVVDAKPRREFDREAIRALSQWKFTPRIENRHFGLYLPVGYNITQKQLDLGIAAHIGPFVLGSSDLGNWAFSPSSKNMNAYAAIRIPINFKKMPFKPTEKYYYLNKQGEKVGINQ